MKPIIVVEMWCIVISLLLIYGNIFETKHRTAKRKRYTILMVVEIFSLATDMISWILDGNEAFNLILYIDTIASLLSSFLVASAVMMYNHSFVSETKKRKASSIIPLNVFLAISSIWTVVECVRGNIFSLENGVYQREYLFNMYIVLSVISMLYIMVDVLVMSKSLGLHDTIAILSFFIFPIAILLVNAFVSEAEYSYPAMTLSALLMYIMLQSDHEKNLIQSEKEAMIKASHDALTDLLNRRALMKLFDEVDDSKEYGVVFCDLNGLKYVNDKLGHGEGDKMLINFAELLTNCFRKNDIFRVSGDEFIIIMNESSEIFKLCANRLHEKLAAMDVPIASMGTAFGTNLPELIKQAEDEMYDEKQEYYKKYPEHHRSKLTIIK